MPTHTINFDPEQYNYLYTSSDDNEMSERVRELVYLGMAVEQSDFHRAKPILKNKHDEWSPDDGEAIDHIITTFVENNE